MQTKVVKWFTGLDLQTSQRLSGLTSRLLQSFRDTKTTQGRTCHFTPCSGNQYSRGVCSKHYNLLRKIAVVVGWEEIAKLGLCKVSKKYTNPLKILIKKYDK